MPSDFQLLSTPSEEEFMFSTRIPQDRIGPNLKFPNGNTLLSAQSAQRIVGASPTKYKDCGWNVGKEMLSKFTEYGEYVYLKSAKQDADHVILYWGKARTPTQRRTPFNSYPDTRQYTWPAVLEDTFVAKAIGFPQVVNNGSTTQTSDRLLPRYRYRPAVPYNSIIIVDQFLSDVAYSSSDLNHIQPIPTDVDGYYIGLSIRHERCLHPTCIFPKIQPESPVYGVGAYPTPMNRNSTSQVFPATNFLDWPSSFVIEDRQQNVNGLWLRERVTIYAPPTPDEVIQ